MKKRRPYLLLELVIAFFLLSICALPLVRNPLHLLKQQYAALEKAELARQAAVDFADIRGRLNGKDEKSITWEQLCKKMPTKSDGGPPDNGEEKITLTIGKPRTYLKKVYWGWVSKGVKKGKEGREIKLINFRIIYQRLDKKEKDIDFNWRALVTRPVSTAEASTPQKETDEKKKS